MRETHISFNFFCRFLGDDSGGDEVGACLFWASLWVSLSCVWVHSWVARGVFDGYLSFFGASCFGLGSCEGDCE